MSTLWIVASLVVVAGPFTYLARNYAAAPTSVPMQIGIDGKPTWYGPKQLLWALAAAPLAVFCLLGLQMSEGRTLKNLPSFFTPELFLFVMSAFLAVITTAGLALLLGRISVRSFSLVFVPTLASFLLLCLWR
jgi:hypothetical protein